MDKCYEPEDEYIEQNHEIPEEESMEDINNPEGGLAVRPAENPWRSTVEDVEDDLGQKPVGMKSRMARLGRIIVLRRRR